MKKGRKIAIKRKGKAVYAVKKKTVVRKRAAKRKRAYNQQMGTLSGREVAAQARLEKLTASYQLQGMSAEDARRRARDEMRANPRRDWRIG